MYLSGLSRPGADCSFLRSNHRARHVRVQPDRGWNGRFVQMLGWNSCSSSFPGVQNCVNVSPADLAGVGRHLSAASAVTSTRCAWTCRRRLVCCVHAPDHAASLSALEISLSVDFSASHTRTPPMPRNPPSLDASATCWLIRRSQPLKAAASPGALASTTAPACRSVSMHLALISLGLLPVNLSFRPSCAVLRPSAVSKSATTALISASAPGSKLAVISALPSAKLSFRRPHRPLGSAAETAIPAIITLSKRSFHSSGVKFDLSGMGLFLYLSSCFDCG